MKNILLYGANGFTGRLILKCLLEKGLSPVLAGRNSNEIQQLANKHGLKHRIFSLEEESKIIQGLDGIKVVIHAAGPFMFTAEPMVRACLKSKVHYLDITGEIDVFEMCSSYDSKAKEAGVMVMPGAGFDVVPSDCLAVHLKERLPDADKIQLAFAGLGGGVSRGTAKTVIENLGNGGAVRKNGKIVIVPNAHKTLTIDFGESKMLCACIPWGDVATAWRSTGIPNIEVFTAVNKSMVMGMKMGNYFDWLLKTPFVKSFLRKRVDSSPPGPSEERRKKARSYFWGKVTNPDGKSCVTLQQTPEGYTLTAETSVFITQKILEGSFKVGYQTPAMAFGPDFILQIAGCERNDL